MSDYIKYVARYPSGNEKSGILSIRGGCRTLVATEHKQPTSVLLPITIEKDNVLSEENTMSQQESNKKVFPCLTPDRAEKRQNGRRFKDDGEPSFTLTSQDIHGVCIEVQPKEIGQNISVKIKEATRQGYAEAHVGDSINLTMPESQTRRGRVGGGGSDAGYIVQSGDSEGDSGGYP